MLELTEIEFIEDNELDDTWFELTELGVKAVGLELEAIELTVWLLEDKRLEEGRIVKLELDNILELGVKLELDIVNELESTLELIIELETKLLLTILELWILEDTIVDELEIVELDNCDELELDEGQFGTNGTIIIHESLEILEEILDWDSELEDTVSLELWILEDSIWEVELKTRLLLTTLELASRDDELEIILLLEIFELELTIELDSAKEFEDKIELEAAELGERGMLDIALELRIDELTDELIWEDDRIEFEETAELLELAVIPLIVTMLSVLVPRLFALPDIVLTPVEKVGINLLKVGEP
jgi:hypothetical protein